MPTRSLGNRIARSVDAPVALLPHFAELFAGMPSLGSQPGVVLRLLRQAGLPRRARVVELACGKGTIAVRLATEFGADVLALDGCAAFLDAARALALRRGVADRCGFELADVHSPATLRRLCKTRFDAAIMLGLDGVETAAPLLRSLVLPGGIYVLDDAVLTPTWRHRTGIDAPTMEQAEGVLEGPGDRIIAAYRPPPSQIVRQNTSLYARLSRNSADLARQHPSLRPVLNTFLRRQREANRLLNSRLSPVVWVVRREKVNSPKTRL